MTDSLKPPPIGREEHANFKGGFFWFDGLLEGPVGDAAAMREHLAPLARLGLKAADVETQGGRFSLLVSDEKQVALHESGLDREAIRSALVQLMQLSSRPQACESTLRSTEIGEDLVRETIYSAKAGQMTTHARFREKTADDVHQSRVMAGVSTEQILLKRKRLLIMAVIVVAGLVVAWQSGIVGSLLAPRGSEIGIEAGDFEGILGVEVEKSGLLYVVTLERGPDFPRSVAEAEQARKEASELLRAAAIETASRGDSLFIEIVDEKGRRLAAIRHNLKALLGDEDSRSIARLPAHQESRKLRLVLSDDVQQKKP